MRACAIALTVVAAFTACAAMVQATPSSIILIPSTDTVDKGTVHMDLDTQFSVGNGSANSSVLSVGATYGVTDRLEVGLDYLSDTTNPLVGNIKLKPYGTGKLAVVVGAWLLGDTSSSGANQLYGLLSYDDPQAGRFAVGYACGSAQAFGPDEDQLWVSYDKALDDKWWVGADYVSGDSAIGSLNFGVGYNLADNVGMILGYGIYNAAGAQDMATVQLDANF